MKTPWKLLAVNGLYLALLVYLSAGRRWEEAFTNWYYARPFLFYVAGTALFLSTLLLAFGRTGPFARPVFSKASLYYPVLLGSLALLALFSFYVWGVFFGLDVKAEI